MKLIKVFKNGIEIPQGYVGDFVIGQIIHHRKKPDQYTNKEPILEYAGGGITRFTK